jgi:hypothetical protein
MDIFECERRAIEEGAYDRATFELVGPGGRILVKWLDADMGIMKAEGESGFWMTHDVADKCSEFGLRIENYQANG